MNISIKNMFYIFLACLISVTIASCDERTAVESEYTNSKQHQNQIYLIDNKTYADPIQLQQKGINLIDDKLTYSTDANVAKSREIQLFDKHSLEYRETVYYPMGDKNLYKYSINNGDETHSVLFNPDGTLQGVFGETVAELNIQPTDSAETVQALLEPSIAYLIDVSKYDYVSVDTWTAAEKEEYFGSYMYIYYNLVDGYQTDWFTVMVWDDGTVSRFIIHDVGVDNIDLNIDKSKETKLLTDTLQTIYNTDSSQYLSYGNRSHPQIIVYKGELSIKYRLDVRVLYTDDQSTELTRICELLIPISEL